MWINKRVTVGGGFNGTLQSKYRVYLDPVWSVKQMSRPGSAYIVHAICVYVHTIYNTLYIQLMADLTRITARFTKRGDWHPHNFLLLLLLRPHSGSVYLACVPH